MKALRPDGRPVTAPICDFCLNPHAHWAYGVSNFVAPDGKRDDSGWAACTRCARLIDTGQYEQLVRVCAKKYAKRERVSQAEMRSALVLLFDRFRRARRGEPVPIEPGHHEDPTRQPDPEQERRYEEMLEWEGDSSRVELDGGALPEDRTFSQDGLEEIENHLITFIGSRVVRKWNKTKRAPHHLRVDVRVTLDGEEYEAGGRSVQLELPDAGHRSRGSDLCG